MFVSITCVPSGRKDHFKLNINGVEMGEWEQSDLRHLIETVDNAIGV